MSNKPPPLPPLRSKNPKLDEAMLLIQTNFAAADRPDVSRAFKLVESLGAGELKDLVALLVPEAWTYGGSGEWDDARAAKMKPPERAAYKKAHDAAYVASTSRERYCGWVLEKLATFPEGCARLAEFLREKKPPAEIRGEAVTALDEAKGPHAAAMLLREFPPSSWDKLLGTKLALPRAAGTAFIRANRARAFDELSPLLIGKKINPVVAEAIFGAIDAASRPPGTSRFGVKPKDKVAIDSRFGDLALRFITEEDQELVAAALSVLIGLPPQKEWRAPLEAALPDLTDDAEELAKELLEKIPAGAASPSKNANTKTKEKPGKSAAASDAPLPPEKRGKAPKPVVPKYDSVAKLGAQIDKLLAKAKLTAHRARVVDAAIHLLTRRTDESKIALGATKLGGAPDLPKGAKWPEHKGCPLGFVAQIKLEDVAKLGEKRLPAKGLLSFFVDDDGEDYLAKAAVIHTKDPSTLTRLEVPATFQKRRSGRPARQLYATCAVTFVPTLTVASPSHPAVTKHMKDDEAAAFEEHVQVEHAVVSQLLGFRNHGYDAENPESARLLLRVTSDAQADMSFGDDDCLDFYVPAKDLAKGIFAKTYPYVGD